ncbi:MAG: type II secretion system protein N [Chromatiales bacterium]|nr:type II secretion system protein N [Chromatiales bacterium]
MRLIVKVLSLLILLLLVVLSVAVTVPLRFIADNTPDLPLAINDVRGTIGNGTLTLQLSHLPVPPEVSAKLKTLIVAWRWCPSLDTGISAMCMEADTELIQGAFTTVISTVAAQFYDVSLTSRLSDIPVPTAAGTTEISGAIQLSLSDIIIPLTASFPTSLQGELMLQDVVVGLFQLGDFAIGLSSDENASLIADITGGGELFTAQGTATLNQDGKYRYNIDVESENAMLRSFLSQQGQVNNTGGYRLAKTGALPVTKL